jgi:hypothetical protein
MKKIFWEIFWKKKSAKKIPRIFQVQIAKRLSIHPAAVCIKWAIQRSTVPIPMSASEKNLMGKLRGNSYYGTRSIFGLLLHYHVFEICQGIKNLNAGSQKQRNLKVESQKKVTSTPRSR